MAPDVYGFIVEKKKTSKDVLDAAKIDAVSTLDVMVVCIKVRGLLKLADILFKLSFEELLFWLRERLILILRGI